MFQSNPTLGQEYRPCSTWGRCMRKAFQSNPTLGQEYRPLVQGCKAFEVLRFNPTRPSARNIALAAA